MVGLSPTGPFVLVDEGDGRCRARLGQTDLVGIHCREGDRLLLCLRGPEQGYPEQFTTSHKEELLTLHRVR